MIDYGIKLDVRDTQPMARAFTVARGDRDAVRLKLSFCDGEQALGAGNGDYATLSLRLLGAEEARTYVTVRDGNVYALVLQPEMVQTVGLYMAVAVLYDQAGMRLTAGRFCFAVREDWNLPADDTLAGEQVALVQQVLGATALLQDRSEQLTSSAESAGSYAQAQGDYAKLWGDAAKNIATQVTVTWDTLAGRPSVFPPEAHSHALLDAAGSSASAHTLAKRDAGGRMQAAAPADAADVARKAEVDALTADVAQKAECAVTYSVTLTASGWAGSSAPYTQTIAQAQAVGGRVSLARLILPADAAQIDAAQKAYARLDGIAISGGSLTASARIKPESDMTLQIAEVG